MPSALENASASARSDRSGWGKAGASADRRALAAAHKANPTDVAAARAAALAVLETCAGKAKDRTLTL